jgi:hypothetical protein
MTSIGVNAVKPTLAMPTPRCECAVVWHTLQVPVVITEKPDLKLRRLAVEKPKLQVVAEQLAKALGAFMKEADTKTAPMALLHGGSEALSAWMDYRRDNGLVA